MSCWTWDPDQFCGRSRTPLRARKLPALCRTFYWCAFFCAGTPRQQRCTRSGDSASSNCPFPRVWTGPEALWENSHLETGCVGQSSSSRCSCLWRTGTFSSDSRLCPPRSDVQKESPGWPWRSKQCMKEGAWVSVCTAWTCCSHTGWQVRGCGPRLHRIPALPLRRQEISRQPPLHHKTFPGVSYHNSFHTTPPASSSLLSGSTAQSSTLWSPLRKALCASGREVFLSLSKEVRLCSHTCHSIEAPLTYTVRYQHLLSSSPHDQPNGRGQKWFQKRTKHLYRARTYLDKTQKRQITINWNSHLQVIVFISTH